MQLRKKWGKLRQKKQGGASYQVATGEPLEGGVPTQVLSGEPQQLAEEGVEDLLHQMSEGRLTGEPIGTNPEEIEDVDKPLDVEHVYEEEEQKVSELDFFLNGGHLRQLEGFTVYFSDIF